MWPARFVDWLVCVPLCLVFSFFLCGIVNNSNETNISVLFCVFVCVCVLRAKKSHVGKIWSRVTTTTTGFVYRRWWCSLFWFWTLYSWRGSLRTAGRCIRSSRVVLVAEVIMLDIIEVGIPNLRPLSVVVRRRVIYVPYFSHKGF